MLFETPKLDAKEREVVSEIREIRTELQPLFRANQPWAGMLRRDLFARGLRGSNSIEGYVASESDALAVVEGDEPVNASDETGLALKGYQDAMSYALQVSQNPAFEYGVVLLTSLHFMMLRHEWRKRPGQWRPGAIFVRDSGTNEIVYEGPPGDLVASLVDELMDHLNTPRDEEESLIVRAGMAHLNLTMIHPFSDGNGRMARVLETLVLARGGILEAPFCSIEEWLGGHTPEYYDVLAEVGQGSWQPSRDPRPWVRFIIRAHYQQTKTLARRMREAGKLFGILESATQRLGLPERVIAPLFNAALGYSVRRSTYCKMAEVGDWQGTRDLKRLSDAGLLIAEGEKRGRFYIASEGLRAHRERSREARTPTEDPFAA